MSTSPRAAPTPKPVSMGGNRVKTHKRGRRSFFRELKGCIRKQDGTLNRIGLTAIFGFSTSSSAGVGLVLYHAGQGGAALAAGAFALSQAGIAGSIALSPLRNQVTRQKIRGSLTKAFQKSTGYVAGLHHPQNLKRAPADIVKAGKYIWDSPLTPYISARAAGVFSPFAVKEFIESGVALANDQNLSAIQNASTGIVTASGCALTYVLAHRKSAVLANYSALKGAAYGTAFFGLYALGHHVREEYFLESSPPEIVMQQTSANFTSIDAPKDQSAARIQQRENFFGQIQNFPSAETARSPR